VIGAAERRFTAMATYLLTIESVKKFDNGMRLSPGIRLSQTSDRPAIGRMMHGAALELRTPMGARHPTTLVTYGVEVERAEDGGFLLRGDPKDAEIKLTLPADLPPDAWEAGTEVWLLAD
jgi:hypothetical protein